MVFGHPGKFADEETSEFFLGQHSGPGIRCQTPFGVFRKMKLRGVSFWNFLYGGNPGLNPAAFTGNSLLRTIFFRQKLLEVFPKLFAYYHPKNPTAGHQNRHLPKICWKLEIPKLPKNDHYFLGCFLALRFFGSVPFFRHSEDLLWHGACPKKNTR